MAFPLPSLNDPHPPEDSAPHLTHHAEQHRCRHPRAQFWEGIGLSSPGHPCVRHGEGKASGGGAAFGGLARRWAGLIPDLQAAPLQGSGLLWMSSPPALGALPGQETRGFCELVKETGTIDIPVPGSRASRGPLPPPAPSLTQIILVHAHFLHHLK